MIFFVKVHEKNMFVKSICVSLYADFEIADSRNKTTQRNKQNNNTKAI